MTDADWAGDVQTRKSTSGGCVLSGSHLLAHWSRTQQVIALSSAESELNAMCRGAQEGLALKHLCEELEEECALTLQTDSSAARGIIKRQGTGKVKHLSVRQLWVQQQVSLGNLEIDKVPRSANSADMLTHHWTRICGAEMLFKMGAERREFQSSMSS